MFISICFKKNNKIYIFSLKNIEFCIIVYFLNNKNEKHFNSGRFDDCGESF